MFQLWRRSGTNRCSVRRPSEIQCKEEEEGHGDVESVFKGLKVAALPLSRCGVGVYLLNSQSNWMSYFDSEQVDQTVKPVSARYCSKSFAQHPFQYV